jgi:hypothetical protein
MNTAANAASALSSVVVGYLVGYVGSYDAPFTPMVALLVVVAVLWLQMDPTVEPFPAKVGEWGATPTPSGDRAVSVTVS